MKAWVFILLAFILSASMFPIVVGGIVNISDDIMKSSNNTTWTFMVYMDADNSLSYYAPDNLAGMMSYGSNKNINIVVLYDSTENGDSALYFIEKGKKKLLESLGEVDMGSEKTLQFFLNWTANNYPAQHYFLDLWDHGNYYHGVCLDHGDWLTLPEINEALKLFDEKIGKKIDIVGFDACRMGGIEIYYSLSKYADYAVASEKDEPASGWPYYEVLSGIVGKSPPQAAKATVNAMYNWAKKFYNQEGLSVTLAAVNLSEIPQFMSNFNDDLRSAISVVPYYGAEIKNKTSTAERYEFTSVVDLYDYMDKMDEINDYKLDRLAKDTMQWITKMSYSKAWDCPDPSNGVHARHAHGVGIYEPLYFVSGDYYDTAFAKNSLWPQFLGYLLNPPQVNGTGNAKVRVDNGMLAVNYTTNGSYVNIYVKNATPVQSGILKPVGNYSVPIEYGLYTLYIYAYNKNGLVIWTHSYNVSNLETKSIDGKFYLNGRIAEGAKITIFIGNRSFTTVQNASGFHFDLNYPSEICSNSTIKIQVIYGFLRWNYVYHIGTMKGYENLPVTLRATLFPSVNMMLIANLVITAYVIITLLFFKKRYYD